MLVLKFQATGGEVPSPLFPVVVAGRRWERWHKSGISRFATRTKHQMWHLKKWHS